jgi:hypothetical protein
MQAPDSSAQYRTKVGERKTASYLLWLGWLFGFAGLHRFYNGKPISGVIWFLTWGCFGIGQVLDLALIPDMAERRTRKLLYGSTLPPTLGEPAWVAPPALLRVQLLKLAQANGGRLTVTQSVIETGASFQAVEAQLKEMLQAGYADVTNDPISGVVVYELRELL